MRLRAALFVALSATRAHADDVHDAFGLSKKPDAVVAPCDTLTLGCVWVDPLDEQTPYALSTYLSRAYLDTLPLGDPTHDQLAGLGLGAGANDGAGPVFGSGNGLENRWTLDGAPIDSGQYGGADLRIPLSFMSGMTITAGGFAARDRVSLGGTIDAQLIKGGATHVVDLRVNQELDTDAAHRPDARETFQLRKLTGELAGTTTATAVVSGPITAGAWYAAGVRARLAKTDITATPARLVDADGDHVADLDGQGFYVLDQIAKSTTRYTSYDTDFMARAGWDSGHHHLDATLIGSYTENTTFLALATNSASGIDRGNFIGDAIATYRGDWTDTRVKLQTGWHRNATYATAHGDGSSPQFLSSYVPATLDDTALAQACVDDPMSVFRHCPIASGFFASGGAGRLTDTTTDRPFVTADLTHRLGDHVLRVGATGEDTRTILDSRFTGGEQIRSLFPGHTDILRFYAGDCGTDASSSCNYQSSQQLNYRTRYGAAYVEDTWSPVRQLRVDYGLRWEAMWVGTKLHFSDELSPRLGLTWDLLGDGHAKAFASMGRQFAMLPSQLGQTVSFRNSTVSDIDVAGLGTGRVVDKGGATLVDPDIQPVAQDEATIGLDVGLAKVAQLDLWVQGRTLERGIDTTSVGFANPGIAGEAPAERSSAIFAVQLQTTGNPALRVGYQYGHAWGTWTGAYDPRQGAVLYAGDDYDAGSINLNGRLPSDQGHRVYIEAVRTGHLLGLAVLASLRMTVGSGRPRDVVASTAEGDYQLIPRGDNGRGPLVTQANAHVEVTHGHLQYRLDVQNLFDHRDAIATDQVYTEAQVLPISGGSASDLIWLRDINGVVAPRSRTYGLGTQFQAPLAIVLGVRLVF